MWLPGSSRWSSACARARRTRSDLEIVHGGLQPRTESRTDLDDRLFSLSGNGRSDLWRVGRDIASEHPVAGSGAGSYKRNWLERRPYEAPVQDAHSLYLEMLAELGQSGWRSSLSFSDSRSSLPSDPATGLSFRSLRRYSSPISPGQAIDWDWEFPILTLVALGCAGVIVAEGVDRPSDVSPWRDRCSSPLRWPSCRSSRSRRSGIVRKQRRPKRSPTATSIGRLQRRRPRNA